jgi:hypothetical protein
MAQRKRLILMVYYRLGGRLSLLLHLESLVSLVLFVGIVLLRLKNDNTSFT